MVKVASGTTVYTPFSEFEIDNIGTTTVNIYAGEMLVASIEDGAMHHNHLDHLSSTRVTTNEFGELAQELDYYPFGSVSVDQQYKDFDQTKRFTGHDYDEETELQYMGARYYDGDIGRFISTDPSFVDLSRLNVQLKDPQSWNSYSYVRNNPLRLVDPTGEFWWTGFYTNWDGYEGVSGIAMKAGEVMGGRFSAQDAIAANRQNILNSSAKTGVNPAVYEAIMYEENAHQFPPFGGERVLENMSPNSFSGGVGVMQVSSKTSGIENSSLINDSINVSAAGQIMQDIKIKYGDDPDLIAAYYNSGKYGPTNTHANLYGQRVGSYANSYLGPTLGDRAVRSSVRSVSRSLSTITSTLSRINDALRKRKDENER